VLAGSTGLVGSHILKTLLNETTFSTVYAYSRKPLSSTSPKLHTIKLEDSEAWPSKFPPGSSVFFSALGTTSKQAGSVEAQKKIEARIKVLEDHLLVNTYLVGERLTLADLFVATLLLRGLEHLFDKTWRDANPNVTRWYETVRNQPIYEGAPKPDFIAQAAKYTPPKKEKEPKKEQPKAAPKAKAPKPAEDDDEDEAPPAPKPKHPLDLLPRSTFVLDDWKRKYSNEDTPVALKWFWESTNFEEYSLWRIDYKYNDELTQVFMSSNLIGGFFNRLEGSRKFLFGSLSVYGTSDNSVIQGAFLTRGQEATPAFDVAPDWESYSFTKLDPKNADDRALVDSAWSWDKPVVVSGKEYPHADGKVFK